MIKLIMKDCSKNVWQSKNSTKRKVPNKTVKPRFSHTSQTSLFSIHLIYEELKLEAAFDAALKFLSEFLYQLSLDFSLENYRVHYFKDNPQLIFLKQKMTMDLNDSSKMLQREIISADGQVLSTTVLLNVTQKPLKF
jgi:hypothetical protein